ncbi:Hypothetical predicted protein [Pelobates cultripes]|uniref:Uncharacterized protein n=1 Tax=Pelobates cultripes TaxID=61616 RepID=A0AAD1TPB4_PELCU|nr:Hypothetical predicted protein [Pelobates cultripes]
MAKTSNSLWDRLSIHIETLKATDAERMWREELRETNGTPLGAPSTATLHPHTMGPSELKTTRDILPEHWALTRRIQRRRC